MLFLEWESVVMFNSVFSTQVLSLISAHETSTWKSSEVSDDKNKLGLIQNGMSTLELISWCKLLTLLLLTPMRDQDRISPYNINKISTR